MDTLDGGVLGSFSPHTAVCSKPMVLGVLFLSAFLDICGTTDCHAVTKHPEFPSLQTLFAEFSLPLPTQLPKVNVQEAMHTCSKVLQTAHEEGLVGLARRGYQHIIEKKNQRETEKKAAKTVWDAAGSVPDKSSAIYGYSETTRIKSGVMTQQVDTDNFELSNKVLRAFSMSEWKMISSRDGIQVFQRAGKDVAVGKFPKGVGAKGTDEKTRAKLLCLWSRGEIDAPISKVYELFLSNEHVQKYNPMCQECVDVGWLDHATKLTWATSRRIGPIYPRDFVTRCHYRKLRDGSLLLATMSEQLACDDLRAEGVSAGKYCRMEVVMGGYLMRSIDAGTRTELNMLTLSNMGGIFDTQIGAAVANMVAATGPLNFIAAVRKLASQKRQ